ncbi:MAG: hypothetical protein V3R99_14055 [Thermoguttaceae bacterium]
MAKKKRKPSPHEIFKQAINSADHLQLKNGLAAVKRGEGKGRIRASDSEQVLGSADIDGDCCRAAPNANRWDYVIGYNRSGNVVAYFVEVHSAVTSEVSRIEKKLQWLVEEFLPNENNVKLAALPREIHWVASGKVKILKHTRQYRFLRTTLRKKGLRGPSKQLTMK